MKGKAWSQTARNRLTALYPRHPKADLLKAFPNRSWKAIKMQAERIGVRRETVDIQSRNYRATIKDEFLTLLRHHRIVQGVSCRELSREILKTSNYIDRAERGIAGIPLSTLYRWCARLGLRLTVEKLSIPISKGTA